MEDCRSISTPRSTTVDKEGGQNDSPEICAARAKKHRAAVARIVYLAQDRLDLAAVELAKTMALPTVPVFQPRLKVSGSTVMNLEAVQLKH